MNEPDKKASMSDRQGVIMTAALMIVAALVGTDEDVKSAIRLNNDDKKILASKYFETAKDVISHLRKYFSK